jgi:hypothetical protein
MFIALPDFQVLIGVTGLDFQIPLWGAPPIVLDVRPSGYIAFSKGMMIFG